jgi:hypothetical protein
MSEGEAMLPIILLSVMWATSTFTALHNMRNLRKAWGREAKLHRMIDEQTTNFLKQTKLLETTTANLNWALDEVERCKGVRVEG